MTGAGAAWRMEAMCAAVGVAVPPEKSADLAGRCAYCTAGEACRLWRLEGHAVRGDLPDYCLNAEAIQALVSSE